MEPGAILRCSAQHNVNVLRIGPGAMLNRSSRRVYRSRVTGPGAIVVGLSLVEAILLDGLVLKYDDVILFGVLVPKHYDVAVEIYGFFDG